MKYVFIVTLSTLMLANCSMQEVKNTQTPPIAETEYSVSSADMLSPTLADTLETSDISEEEKKSLLQMREEEKLAHDVYTALYQKWGKQIFGNIAASEQTHTGAVLGLLKKYNIPDPAKSETGVFTAPEIQKLYDTLVAQGNNSLLEALIVGATIEDLDIYDIDTQMKNIDNADITMVYSQLKRGSENHMRAFVRNISQAG
ncbi:DUF2202 domain-containing protein [Candidatus Peribacteria bacterium]|nr:DUF2202 domain-containing protein [Candidatus Peribacteria bacterium]